MSAPSPASSGRARRDRWLARIVHGCITSALVAGALASGGCYRYASVSPAAATSDGEVRIHITQPAAARLAAELDTYSTEIDGQLSSRGPDTMAVIVPIVRAYRGTTLDSTTQVFLLGRSEIVDVGRREFSRGRTILAVGGVVVGFALLARAIVQVMNPNPGEQEPLPPPPPPQVRIPSGPHPGVRIPIP